MDDTFIPVVMFQDGIKNEREGEGVKWDKDEVVRQIPGTNYRSVTMLRPLLPVSIYSIHCLCSRNSVPGTVFQNFIQTQKRNVSKSDLEPVIDTQWESCISSVQKRGIGHA